MPILVVDRDRALKFHSNALSDRIDKSILIEKKQSIFMEAVADRNVRRYLKAIRNNKQGVVRVTEKKRR